MHCKFVSAFLKQVSALCGLMFGIVLGVAPGDENCTTLQPHASDVVVLMDSFNYITLLPSTWTAIDIDGNGLTWYIGVGGTCQQTINSNTTTPSASDWLFTQLISKNVSTSVNIYPINISLSVTARFSQCSSKLLSVYKYVVSTTSTSAYNDLSKYSLINNITGSVTSSSVTYSLSFIMQPEEKYFYIGFRGTCLFLSHVVVSRSSAQSKQVELLMYPEVPYPSFGSAVVAGVCSLYSSTLSGNAPMLTISSQGQWLNMGETQCYCLPGYRYDAVSKICAVCYPGTFKSTLSNNDTCQSCPLNSMVVQSGALVCPCNSGYIRPALKPAQDCIQPPSSPKVYFPNSLSVSSNSITQCWLPPSNPGGRPQDLFYNIYIQNIGTQSNQCLTKVNSSYSVENGPTCLTINNLDSTLYAVYVVSANAATSDPDTVCNITVIDGRYLAIIAQTQSQMQTGNAEKSTSVSTAAAVSITFFITLLIVMVAAIIAVLIAYFVGKERSCDKPSLTTKTSTVSVTKM